MLNYSGVFESGDTSQLESKIINLEAKDNSFDSRITALENGIGATILKDTESLSSISQNGIYVYGGILSLSKDNEKYTKVILKVPSFLSSGSGFGGNRVGAQEITLVRDSTGGILAAYNSYGGTFGEINDIYLGIDYNSSGSAYSISVTWSLNQLTFRSPLLSGNGTSGFWCKLSMNVEYY